MLPYKSGTVRVTSKYGARTLNGVTAFHSGVDFVGTNKEIVAVADGTILESTIVYDKTNINWQCGNYIKIDIGSGVVLYYFHLSERLVNKGDTVRAGQVIGIEGSTGYSTGSHLHFEIRRNGKSINAADYLKIPNVVGTVLKIEESEGDEMIRYAKLRDIPNDNGFRDIIETLMDAHIINGDGSDPTGNDDVIDLSHDQVRSLVFEYRGGAFDRKLISVGMKPAVNV
jgi:hypothetical protein